MYSCEVASACQGRYDPIYSSYGIENEPFRRKRSADGESSGTVAFTAEHPCNRILKKETEMICIEASNTEPTSLNRCWTEAVCEAHKSKIQMTEDIENIVFTGDASVCLASATTFALSAYFLL